MTSFADFGLHPDILRAVSEMGYATPTPIQEQAIPVVMTGKDVMGAAQTGTGKTAGFSLPILHRLMPLASTSSSPARHPVRALMLAPTRELADQIYANVRDYAKHTPIRVACVFGGVDMKPQVDALRMGVEVLIATPGRLLDHVQQKTVNLSQASILVLDEADRMLDMGFIPDIQRIINLLPKPRQSLMFSATFSEEIKKLAKSFLSAPVSIEVARPNMASEQVTQEAFKVGSVEDKRHAVAQLVRDRALSQVIVFSNTKLGTSRLARQLERDGLKAGAIHGDKTQQERLKTLEEFKKGEIAVLVATDVAARGLDISDLPAVINFDLPHSPEDYVHRIGRTGRAGATGVALSLMAPGDDRYLADIEKLIKRKVPVQALAIDPALSGNEERAPYAQRGERHDRAERGERHERGDRNARNEPALRTAGARSSIPRSSSADPRRSARKKAPLDPLFSQPYEPSEAADPQQGIHPETAAPTRAGVGTSSIRRGVRTVPALLGGLRGAKK